MGVVQENYALFSLEENDMNMCYVVIVDDRTIGANNYLHARTIYKTYAHARLERWDLIRGTARTIKEK